MNLHDLHVFSFYRTVNNMYVFNVCLFEAIFVTTFAIESGALGLVRMEWVGDHLSENPPRVKNLVALYQ
jgi:hypothetical protein